MMRPFFRWKTNALGRGDASPGRRKGKEVSMLRRVDREHEDGLLVLDIDDDVVNLRRNVREREEEVLMGPFNRLDTPHGV